MYKQTKNYDITMHKFLYIEQTNFCAMLVCNIVYNSTNSIHIFRFDNFYFIYFMNDDIFSFILKTLKDSNTIYIFTLFNFFADTLNEIVHLKFHKLG